MDYQRLLGFAVIEGALKPKIPKFEHADQKYLTWVEGTGDVKDIVWKSIHGPSQNAKISSIYEKQDGHGNGPVVLNASKGKQLFVIKHDSTQHMPK